MFGGALEPGSRIQLRVAGSPKVAIRSKDPALRSVSTIAQPARAGKLRDTADGC